MESRERPVVGPYGSFLLNQASGHATTNERTVLAFMQLKLFLLILENEGEERMIFKKLKNVAILNT